MLTVYVTMSNKLHIGVAGAGVFGGYHAAKFNAHPQCQLTAIYDPSWEKARGLAAQYGATGFSDFEAFLDAVQAVIIASPAMTHGALALQALTAGKHCLIEKPIAADIETAKQICERAERKKCVLQIGHQERFILSAIGLYDITETPQRIETRRYAPYSERGTDVSATLDLMVHDLDMVMFFMGDPLDVQGWSIPVRSITPDAALGLMQFANGSARLETSRVEATSQRIMTLHYSTGQIVIDFNAKTIANTTKYDLPADYKGNSAATDALAQANNAFINSIIDAKPVAITGKAGLAAMRAALIIDGDL